MKSDIDIKDDIFRVVVGSSLREAVNGEVTKSKRPHDSRKEDIVISVVSNLTAQLQEATVNVNVYCEGQRIGRQTEENSSRLRELSQVALEVLDNVRGEDFHLEVQEQRVYEVVDEYVINNKLLYKIINE